MHVIAGKSGRPLAGKSGYVIARGGTLNLPAPVVTGLTLSSATGAANSAPGTAIGTLSWTSTGATLANPKLTLTNSAGGNFALVGNQVQFFASNVPAGSYTITAQLSADNLPTPYPQNFAITVNAGSASAAVMQVAANMPTSGTALTPLSQGTLVFQNILIAYIVLYHNGADEGARIPFGGGQTPALAGQDYANGGSYTIRLYDAPTGGNCFYESAPFTLATNPGQVGGTTSAITWPNGSIYSSAAHGTSAMAQDDYWSLSGVITEGDLYLTSSSTQAPDVPAGAATIIGQQLNVTLQNVTTLYGSVRNMSQRPTYTGTAYLWMCVNGIDGTRSRLCNTGKPITIT